jgi:6-phosphofructokinase 1
MELKSCFKFLKAGAMKEIVFSSKETNAAIVTCGGLCPGQNTVLKSIVECLSFEYGVNNIWGIKWGYRGFVEDDSYWIKIDS